MPYLVVHIWECKNALVLEYDNSRIPECETFRILEYENFRILQYENCNFDRNATASGGERDYVAHKQGLNTLALPIHNLETELFFAVHALHIVVPQSN